MTLDASTIIILILAAVLAGALFGILPAWRRFMTRGAELPVWKFSRRAGAARDAVVSSIGERAVFEGEVRCTLCAAQKECEQRLSYVNAVPVFHCPNAALFPELHEHR